MEFNRIVIRILLFMGVCAWATTTTYTQTQQFLHLCEGLYIYDAPAPDATITKVLYFENLVDLEGTASDADHNTWLSITRTAADPSLIYSGWVSASDLANCPPPANIYQMLTKDAPHLLQPGDIESSISVGKFSPALPVGIYVADVVALDVAGNPLCARSTGRMPTGTPQPPTR